MRRLCAKDLKLAAYQLERRPPGSTLPLGSYMLVEKFLAIAAFSSSIASSNRPIFKWVRP